MVQTPSNILIPATVTGSQFRYIAISAGQTHSMAIKDDFTFWTAGFNNQGQLGLGNFANTNALNQVGTGTNWFFVSAGFVHSHALETTTDLWSAGRGLEGQLGVGSFTNSNVIVIVTCPTTPLSIQDNVLEKFEVNVYPNPTKGLAAITYNLINDAAITIRLTNIQGQILQEISSQKLSGIQTENIDLGALSNGIYFLSITNANATYSAKLIKK